MGSSVRIMGARLVIDSYIFDQLVMPNVDQRFEASPLDLAAALGSDWALAATRARARVGQVKAASVAAWMNASWGVG